MKYLAAILSVLIFSSFSTKVAQQKPECETYTIGGIKIINQTNHAVSGRICLKKVDKRTGRIHPEFCPEFSLSIGGET